MAVTGAKVQVPCPWHSDAMAQLLDQHARGRLPHALLLSGPKGIGKLRLAESLAQTLLCEKPSAGLPCGHCQGCQLSTAGTHPDLYRLSPEEKSKTIKIDQVRKLVAFATRTAQYSGYRVAIISPAEALNRNAQNALLKTLEEPGTQTLLLLVSDQPTLLLPTIRSRCQQRILPLPVKEHALQWLQSQVGESAASLLDAAQGAPLRALALEQAEWFADRTRLLDTLVRVAEGRQSVAQASPVLAKHDPTEMASVIYGWLSRSLNQRFSGQQSSDALLAPLLERLNKAVPPARLLRAAQRVLEGRRALLSGANPNKELLYEQWLLVLVGVDAAAAAH
ncbi:MAG: DNA polymerase III subunit delta' [Alcanivorax borkumensis]|jgi:DNA polymerase-3 subunit delta'|uniref:DNA polymerase III subunit delta' n=1 Tax=Alcanivorax borkumensis (strain ATCC 700651 / DSM 11573 / NCIMB 13689 / SK2) TaxID=393595 RepID=Q0VQM5_ALCBS|nr:MULTISPECIES: DNA polymerase III subunit delta' [Alcanivorax]OJH07407.1 MAG: DNA polymerase III subunit delta' [Alcanivorax borkumensis]BAP13992.1 DNA polymerase III subunit delta' [Alcanivorax sp. NBRC 101098]CAL16523.1 DNA polymerase III, delta prime subunit [Alcanivorax borkumensis SK2]